MFSTGSLYVQGQHKLELEVNSNGFDRELFKASNTINSSLSAAVMNISSGTGNLIGQGYISIFSQEYNGNNGYAGYFDLQGATKGVLLRASDPNGNIRFLTGGNTIATQTRLFINPLGQIGIGTDSPSSALEVANGAVYLSSPSSTMILTSPNGSCWNITVSNAGALTTTSGPCP